MLFLSYAYRFLSNFVFLALVYLALNFLEKYQHRVVVAVLVLVYAGMHAASALRSFHFFQRIERLEAEARRLAVAAAEGPNAATARKQIVGDCRQLKLDQDYYNAAHADRPDIQLCFNFEEDLEELEAIAAVEDSTYRAKPR